jgi:LuxR family maltose regulon positive regulatory protein
VLRALTKHSDAPGYGRRLLAATTRTQHRPVQPAALVEPLSDREPDVLRLIGTDLDRPDIARALTVH